MKNKKQIIICTLIWLYIVLVIGNGIIIEHGVPKGVNMADLPQIIHTDGNINYTARELDSNSFQMLLACVDNGYSELCLSDLWAIAQHESWNDINQMPVNSNGTVDLGLFGINSIHKVPLECLADAYCSADWVIKRLKSKGYDTDRIDAIGRYHSETPEVKARYIAKISKYLTVK